ncbi:hypothetical protein [Paraflavitalea speifideaquila]|uniref:hypothetical protein n=1 Tax=Paraflavitalea speifideaquila TaxID=3076558 RepID=UPI0028E76D70|nr:hypothetical protein [Paraflavitalea speifideiaquila]
MQHEKVRTVKPYCFVFPGHPVFLRQKGGGNDNCSESALQVSTTPANGSTEPAGPGPNFPLQVNITANLPTDGVTIEITAGAESGGTPFSRKPCRM